jgi:hypothetical protein
MIGFRQPRGRQVRKGVRAAAGSWDSLVAAVMPAVEAARRRVDEAARDAAERADQIRAQGATVCWFTSAVLGNDHAMARGTVIGYEEYRRRPPAPGSG